MTLNKSNGNMYEWITATWNPLAGKCPHACSYCSTNKFYYPELIKKYSGEPRLAEKELTTNLGKDNFIFVVAQNDLFSKEIPNEWIIKVLDYCDKFQNKYLFQSKNPARILEFTNHKVFNKSVVCTTIETNRYYPDIMLNSPDVSSRAFGMNKLSQVIKTYVTIEPIMDFDIDIMIQLLRDCLPEQVNIGANTSNKKLPEPSKEKIIALISKLENFTKVKQKSNLARLLK